MPITSFPVINVLNTVTSWVSFTPTGTWTANTTYLGERRVVRDTLEVRVEVQLAGAPTSAVLDVDLPSGFTIDTTKLTSEDIAQFIGELAILDAGTSNLPWAVRYLTTTRVNCGIFEGSVNYANITQAVPITFASGDRVFIKYSVPVL